MTLNRFNILVGLTLISGLLLSCGNNKPKNGRTDTYSKGTVSFVCDSSFCPIIDEQKEIFELMYKEAHLKPVYTNEVEGVKMLMDEKVWLAITTRNFTPKEKNPDSCISVKDIKRILSGEVKKWNEVYPKSKLGDFDVVFDNAQSSTVRFCVDSILKGKLISSPLVTAVKRSEDVINYVSSHKGALGVIGSNWLNDKRDTTNVTFNKNIRVVSVSRLDSATVQNSWKPYQYYIYNGNYPLVRTIYALLNDPRMGLPSGFAAFLQSPNGQRIFLRAGLLPAYGQLNVREVNVSQ